MFVSDGSVCTAEYGRHYGNIQPAATDVHGMNPSQSLPVRWHGLIPSAAVDSIANRFFRLRDEWFADVAFSSSMDEIVESEPYKEIIMMGWTVVPLILKDLQADPKPWFFALFTITGSDPVKARDAGNMRKMSDAWLAWARKHDHI